MVGAGAEGCFLIAFNLSMEMVGVKVKPTNLYVCGNSNFFKNIVIRAKFRFFMLCSLSFAQKMYVILLVLS